MANVTSAFTGITTPVSHLYHEIHQRGWNVTKVAIKDGIYVAEAKSATGESAEKTGRDVPTALGALLLYIVRREHIRTTAWNKTWVDQLEPIAQSYAKAPVFDPKAALAWKELADDSVARAAALAAQLQIEYTHDPAPYESPQKLWEDVQKKRHLTVSKSDLDHPVWTPEQVLAFRTCHDVLGHATAGADWGWTGTNLAAAAHMPHLSPNAQRALFTEVVGKGAYNTYHRGFGPTKITFLDEHLSPLQEEHNPDGHMGEHPTKALVPGLLPVRAAGKYPELPCPNCGHTGEMHSVEKYNTDILHCRYCGKETPVGNDQPLDQTLDLEDFGDMMKQNELPLGPPRWGATVYQAHYAGVKRDPNYKFDTGITPPEMNALTAYGDPLEHMQTKDMAHKIDTGWHTYVHPDGTPDYDRMRQAIANAFRVALLSPKKELRWNAVQYQDISHIPYQVTDPKVYWDALKEARIHHNRALGDPNPEVSYQAHYKSLLEFYRYYQKHHPSLTPSQLKEAADREVMIMQAEIEREHMATSDSTTDIIEPKVFKELDKRLKRIIKDDKPLGRSAQFDDSVSPGGPYEEMQKTKARYGGVIANQLIAIASISRYIDLLLESALEDVKV